MLRGESRSVYWLAVEVEGMTHGGKPLYAMIACDDAADVVNRIFEGENCGRPFRVFVEITIEVKEV